LRRVQRAAGIDFRRGRPGFPQEGFARLGQCGLAFQRLDHPGMRRLAGRFRERCDALFEVCRQFDRRRCSHWYARIVLIEVLPK